MTPTRTPAAPKPPHRPFTIVDYPIPSSVAYTKTELPAGQKLLGNLGQYAGQPTVDGQVCDVLHHRDFAFPIAGRQWMWWNSRD